MATSGPPCKYGSKCYRKNPQHLKQYSHPTPRDTTSTRSSNEDIVVRKRKREEDGGENARENERENEEELSACKRDNITATVTPPSDDDDILNKEETKGLPLLVEKEGEKEALDKGGGGREEKESDGEVESDDVRENVKRKFLVQMPDDFYQFWDFCNTLCPDDPLHALSSTLQLSLVGPYHLLAGKLKSKGWRRCILHYRYYYDPPELVTVLAREEQEKEEGEREGFHIGYYRDEPSNTEDCFMVANTSSNGCTLTHTGLNIFAAVRNEVIKKLKNKKLSKTLKEDLQSLENSLTNKGRELGLNMKDLKPSKRKPVAKCFNGIGMCVPVNSQLDIGYRPLHMSNKQLQQLLDKIVTCSSTDESTKHDQLSESLHEMITCVQFANDESDYGMGLELGTDLWCHGSDQFHDHVLRILPLAYELLERNEYSMIVQEHVKNRQYVPLDLTNV